MYCVKYISTHRQHTHIDILTHANIIHHGLIFQLFHTTSFHAPRCLSRAVHPSLSPQTPDARTHAQVSTTSSHTRSQMNNMGAHYPSRSCTREFSNPRAHAHTQPHQEQAQRVLEMTPLFECRFFDAFIYRICILIAPGKVSGYTRLGYYPRTQ